MPFVDMVKLPLRSVLQSELPRSRSDCRPFLVREVLGAERCE